MRQCDKTKFVTRALRIVAFHMGVSWSDNSGQKMYSRNRLLAKLGSVQIYTHCVETVIWKNLNPISYNTNKQCATSLIPKFCRWVNVKVSNFSNLETKSMFQI